MDGNCIIEEQTKPGRGLTTSISTPSSAASSYGFKLKVELKEDDNHMLPEDILLARTKLEEHMQGADETEDA